MHIANQLVTGDNEMDLTLWIPLTVGLGLTVLTLFFAFVEACDRI